MYVEEYASVRVFRWLCWFLCLYDIIMRVCLCVNLAIQILDACSQRVFRCIALSVLSWYDIVIRVALCENLAIRILGVCGHYMGPISPSLCPIHSLLRPIILHAGQDRGISSGHALRFTRRRKGQKICCCKVSLPPASSPI